jgi:mono/diheme cytochrome c family protein
MPSINKALVFSSMFMSANVFAAPWDVDMVDSDFVRGYECWEYATDEDGKKVCVRTMAILPEGVVAQKNILTPNHIMTTELPKGDSAWDSVTSPLDANEKAVVLGSRMYDIYCSPCHGKVDSEGVIAELGTVANRIAGVIALTGKDGVLKNRSDGRVYSTIRQGAAIMPAYNWAMTDTEMWSIVHYVRTLDQAQYKPPVPASSDVANDGGAQ